MRYANPCGSRRAWSRDKFLDRASQLRGWDALKRFGERLRDFHPDHVRAVATNTLRVAKNADEFLAEAQNALGFPIEVIAGREEARLIYAGAAHSVPASAGKRLVVDIGGGSTEFIIGSHYTPIHMESLYIGCVSHSRQFFAAGNVDEYSMRQAELAAKREIEIISSEYKQTGWDQAIGSSGTARALAELIEANGFNDPGITHGISRGGAGTAEEGADQGRECEPAEAGRAEGRPDSRARGRLVDNARRVRGTGD
jgi:exopolyphosphatase/guanosine-5'-triphosphate,3'-diphosphate pyrophosphatase